MVEGRQACVVFDVQRRAGLGQDVEQLVAVERPETERTHHMVDDRPALAVDVAQVHRARLLNRGERIWKEGNGLFNDALNTFYLRLYGVRHMVKDHSDSEREREKCFI